MPSPAHAWGSFDVFSVLAAALRVGVKGLGCFRQQASMELTLARRPYAPSPKANAILKGLSVLFYVCAGVQQQTGNPNMSTPGLELVRAQGIGLRA